MNFKEKVKALGAVLGVLVLLFVIGIITRSITYASQAEPLFAQTDKAEVQKITLTDKDGSIEFTKHDSEWDIIKDGITLPGSKDAIDGLAGSITGTRKSRIATEKKENWEQYAVDDKSATHVVLSDAKGTVIDIYLGKSAEDGVSQFVRIAGKDQVIQTVDRLMYSSKTREWINHAMIPQDIKVGEIDKISVRSILGFDQSGNLDLVNWHSPQNYTVFQTIKDGKPSYALHGNSTLQISQARITDLLYNVINFNNEDIVLDTKGLSLSLSLPLAEITLSLNGGKTYTIAVVGYSRENNAVVYVTDKINPSVYSVMAWNINRVLPKLESLVEQPQPAQQ
ncbi:MAG: DUF4340 domain-containing protein [Spirochaetaceae bacterium]|nr:MAG: DUF4340 domain-containing protein [Spirochaetaceae bacterium]